MFSVKQSPLGSIALKPGERSSIRLLNSMKNLWTDFVFGATLDVAVAGTKVLNRGSILAAYSEMGLMENQNARIILDPRVAGYVAQQAAPSALSVSRAKDATVQAGTVLREMVRLYYAHPYAAAPAETAYLEHNNDLELAAYVTPAKNGNGVDRIIKGGTAAVTNPSVRVTQYSDMDSLGLPYFIPTARQMTVTVNGAQSQFEIPIVTNHRLRALHIMQETTGEGECTDIIETVGLRGDRRQWIDPQRDWDEFVRGAEMEYGGDVYGTPRGSHALINFQVWGRLAKVMFPAIQDSNLKLVFGCKPSASGSGSSQIRVTFFELERDLFINAATGRRVTDPELPPGL